MSLDNKIYIIAEIGINHNGSLDIAKQLIDIAKVAGCDVVKFKKEILISASQSIKNLS